MTEFDTSLSVGKLREAELIEFFQSKGHKPIPIPGKFSGFDFFLANTKQGYEVKQDWKAHYSGNLVVEVEMYGKRSGLMATTADWWIFDTKDEFIFITPKQLKDLIVEQNPPLRQFTGKGDTQPKKAYLIPVQRIKNYASSIIKR
ncbi:hypothetical protein [uncultured Mediterranean phage uvMED]|jgi:hypothetical protein|nr:hypothetical protein [uncultured Mediterranean phage uvMED]